MRTERLSSTVRMRAIYRCSFPLAPIVPGSGFVIGRLGDPNDEIELPAAAQHGALMVRRLEQGLPGFALDDAGQAERVVQPQGALDLTGGHVEELAQRIVHHGGVELIRGKTEQRRAQPEATGLVGREQDLDLALAIDGEDGEPPRRRIELTNLPGWLEGN